MKIVAFSATIFLLINVSIKENEVGRRYSSSNYTGNTNINTSNANSVTLTAQWQSVLPSFYTITYMQDMTSAVCNSVQTPSTSATVSVTKSNYSSYGQSTSYVPETTLKDSRDSQSYTVRKLADGQCWMVQDLDLVPNTSKTYTSSDTDLNAKSSYIPSASNNFPNVASKEAWYDPDTTHNIGAGSRGNYYS